ncbi:MAG: SUF system NifU family Fe-S cluster assembly protein [Acidobacteria bacterium]|nr:SUF system NifU family Fe-S cluster assembly protein [Acidobacteriota bacterium]
MSNLSELYQELIVDHSKHPRNFGKLVPADHQATGYNPLCGDKVTVYLKLDDARVAEARFEGVGCAISTASASLMTERIKGKTLAEAEALFQNFHELVTVGHSEPSALEQLGKLKVFAGVRDYPVRVKCATLAWHTFRAALRGEEPDISID